MSVRFRLSLIGLALSAFLAAPTFAADTKPSAANGFYVYKAICSTCHSMNELHYGDFKKLGIPTKVLSNWAATKSLPDGLDDHDQLRRRPATLDDVVASPYPTERAARDANGGDLPLDLSSISLLIKGGDTYILDMLKDYPPVPKDMVLKSKEYYNPTALTHHHHYHMPSPWELAVAKDVVYPGNIHPIDKQMAEDVTAFINWAATPYQSKRAFFGYLAVAYSIFMSVIFFLLRHKIWSGLPKSS